MGPSFKNIYEVQTRQELLKIIKYLFLVENVTFSEGTKFDTNLKSGVHFREAHQLTIFWMF